MSREQMVQAPSSLQEKGKQEYLKQQEKQNTKEMKRVLSVDYQDNLTQTLKSMEFDDATKKQLREFLLNPLVKSEIVRQTVQMENGRAEIDNLLKLVIDHKDAVDRQIKERETKIKSLKGKLGYWKSQETKLKGMGNEALMQKIKDIGDRKKLLERQIRDAEKTKKLDLRFDMIPGSTITQSEVRSAKSPIDDEEVDFDSGDTSHTPTEKLYEQLGIKPTQPLDTETIGNTHDEPSWEDNTFQEITKTYREPTEQKPFAGESTRNFKTPLNIAGDRENAFGAMPESTDVHVQPILKESPQQQMNRLHAERSASDQATRENVMAKKSGMIEQPALPENYVGNKETDKTKEFEKSRIQEVEKEKISETVASPAVESTVVSAVDIIPAPAAIETPAVDSNVVPRSSTEFQEQYDKDNYEEARRIVIDSGNASITLLQRKMGITQARAHEMIQKLEADGVIGPDRGIFSSREVLLSPDGDVAVETPPVDAVEPVSKQPDAIKPIETPIEKPKAKPLSDEEREGREGATDSFLAAWDSYKSGETALHSLMSFGVPEKIINSVESLGELQKMGEKSEKIQRAINAFIEDAESDRAYAERMKREGELKRGSVEKISRKSLASQTVDRPSLGKIDSRFGPQIDIVTDQPVKPESAAEKKRREENEKKIRKQNEPAPKAKKSEGEDRFFGKDAAKMPDLEAELLNRKETVHGLPLTVDWDDRLEEFVLNDPMQPGDTIKLGNDREFAEQMFQKTIDDANVTSTDEELGSILDQISETADLHKANQEFANIVKEDLNTIEFAKAEFDSLSAKERKRMGVPNTWNELLFIPQKNKLQKAAQFLFGVGGPSVTDRRNMIVKLFNAGLEKQNQP